MVVVANNLGRTSRACYQYIKVHKLRRRVKGQCIMEEVAKLTAKGMHNPDVSKELGVSQYHVRKAKKMATKVEMFESVDGELYETEEEADEADALEELRKASLTRHLSEAQTDIICEIIDNIDMMRAFVAYAKQRKARQAMGSARNEQEPKVKEILKNG